MWTKDILRAFFLVLAAAVFAIIVNEVRTPVLKAAAEKGRISKARAWDLSGLKLIDDWSHRGWVKVASEPQGEKPAENAEGEQHEPVVWPVDSVAIIRQIYEEGECVFADARSPESYEEGHIPGAINWPADRFDEYLEKYGETVPFDQCVVAYCIGGSCDESYHLATSLVLEGWREVYLFTGGMEEWRANGYEVETGQPGESESESEGEQ